MLLFNPNLPRVQREIGALYYRTGSYDLARDYFERAAEGNPPPEVRANVEQYLAEIEKSQSRQKSPVALMCQLGPGSARSAFPAACVPLTRQTVTELSVLCQTRSEARLPSKSLGTTADKVLGGAGGSVASWLLVKLKAVPSERK
jgi:hypothetical protein